MHTEGHSVMDGSWIGRRMMDGWMDGGHIWIALERSSSESSKDVMSISVSHLIWKEEIMLSKMKYQNQNGILNKKVAIHTYFILEHT